MGGVGFRWTDCLKVRNHIATGVKGFFNGCNDIGATLPKGLGVLWAFSPLGLTYTGRSPCRTTLNFDDNLY